MVITLFTLKPTYCFQSGFAVQYRSSKQPHLMGKDKDNNIQEMQLREFLRMNLLPIMPNRFLHEHIQTCTQIMFF